MSNQNDIAESLFPDWIPPRYPDWIRGCSRAEKSRLASLWSLKIGPIRQAEQDGLEQLVPVIVVTGQTPERLRADLGKAVWRKIHHASLATNAQRAILWMRFFPVLDWAELMEIRPGALASVNKFCRRGWRPAALYAGSHVGKYKFRTLVTLYEDAERLGVTVNPRWSLARLQKEHDAAGLKAAVARHSPKPWAEPFTFEAGGYRFDRLISDLDLGHEGFSMRHCVAGYSQAARAEQLFIFRITGPERATVALNRRGAVHDLTSFANGPVTMACRAAVTELRLELRDRANRKINPKPEGEHHG